MPKDDLRQEKKMAWRNGPNTPASTFVGPARMVWKAVKVSTVSSDGDEIKEEEGRWLERPTSDDGE